MGVVRGLGESCIDLLSFKSSVIGPYAPLVSAKSLMSAAQQMAKTVANLVNHALDCFG